jgi:predicted ATP-dependent serine protease
MLKNYFDKENNKAEKYQGYQKYSAYDLMTADYEEIPYLWNPFICKGELSAVIGPGDVGKSILLRDLSIKVVNGDDNYLGFPLKRDSGKVLYVSLEDNKYRLSHQLVKTTIDKKLAQNLEFITLIDRSEEGLDILEYELDENSHDLVIIDPISNIIFKDWKDQGALREELLKFQRLAVGYNTAMVFIHHITKEAYKSAPNAINAVGSQAFGNAVRSVLEVRRRPGSPSERGLFVTKGNGLSDDYKSSGIALKMNEDFSYSKLNDQVSLTEFEEGSSARTHPHKEKAMEIIADMLKAGKTQAEAIRRVMATFPDNPPSAASIKNWYNGK